MSAKPIRSAGERRYIAIAYRTGPLGCYIRCILRSVKASGWTFASLSFFQSSLTWINFPLM